MEVILILVGIALFGISVIIGHVITDYLRLKKILNNAIRKHQ